MLAISRREGESVTIIVGPPGSEQRLKIIHGGRKRGHEMFLFDGPMSFRVHRTECLEKKPASQLSEKED